MEPLVSLVIVNWNRCNDLRNCLTSIRKQSYQNLEIIIVDNQSTDGSIEMIQEEFPDVKLIVMPDTTYGACETFNIGFSSCSGKYTGILDNDIILPADWIKDIIERFEIEPENTAIISTKVIEPEMPEDYIYSDMLNRERYIDTFVGCGSVARSDILKEAGYYDKKFFIHVNERDLALTLLKQGYRILHYPKVCTYHKKPFGIHKGNRSLYYHIRNYVWVLVKHYSIKDIASYVFQGLIILTGFRANRTRSEGENQLLGTVGLKEEIFQSKGGLKTAIKALVDALIGLPYCLKHRQACKPNSIIEPSKQHTMEIKYEEKDEL